MDNYSYQLNGSLTLRREFQYLSSAECTALSIVFGTESVVTVILNVLTIIVYLKERSLRKPSMYLVINLAVADMFNGGFSIVTLLSEFNRLRVCKFSWFNEIWHFLPLFLMLLFTNASVVSLAAVSVERMHATFRPLKHRLIEKRIYGAAVSAVWLTAGVCSYLTLISHVFLSCCFLIILVSYSSIAIKIYCGRYPQHHGGGRRERKLTKTLFIITSASLLLTLPVIVLLSYSRYAGSSFNFLPDRTLIYLVLSLFFLFQANSLVNPLLYALRMPRFKRAFFSFLACRSHVSPIQDFALNIL